MQATSRDWLNLIITATPVPDFAAQPVDVSLSPDQFNPTTDWFPAEHTAQGLRLMIGPGTDPGQLQPGSWHAWGRLTALGDGTLPVFYIGAFLIEGGSGLAPMPPTTIGQAALDAAINGVLPGGLDPTAAALVGSGGAFDLSLKAAYVPQATIPGYETAASAEYPRLVKPLDGPVLSFADQPAESMLWPWLVDNSLDGVGTGWSLWYSTDHAALHSDSGLFAATAPSPLGPYTSVGRIYRDDVSGAGHQCETPSIIWDPVASLWRIYYQLAGVTGTASNQVTLMATAPAGGLLDPAQWTRYGVVIDAYDPMIPGALVHQGYLRPMRYAGGWYGWNLLGGTFGGTQQQRSMDGITWTPAGRTAYQGPLINQSIAGFDPTTWIMKHTLCSVLDWRGRPWWIGGVTGEAAGTETAPPMALAVAPLSPTLDRITAPLKEVTPPIQGWETASAVDGLGNAARWNGRTFIPYRSLTKVGAFSIMEVI